MWHDIPNKLLEESNSLVLGFLRLGLITPIVQIYTTPQDAHSYTLPAPHFNSFGTWLIIYLFRSCNDRDFVLQIGLYSYWLHQSRSYSYITFRTPGYGYSHVLDLKHIRCTVGEEYKAQTV